jgi:20S proteasome alpha/beta subunit
MFLFVMLTYVAHGKSSNDLSLHQYTERGEVSQIYYASKTIDKSKSAVLAFLILNSIVIFTIRPRSSKLLISHPSDKTLEILAPTMIVAMIGYQPDCEYTRTQCNLIKNSHMLTFGEIPSAKYLQRVLSKWITRGMYREETSDDSGSIARPLGISILLANYDSDADCESMSLIENSGMYRDCSFAAIGSIPGGKLFVERLKAEATRWEQDCESLSSQKETEKNRVLFDKIRVVSNSLWEEASAESSDSGRLTSFRASSRVSDPGLADDGREQEGAIEVECCVVRKAGIIRTGRHSTSRELQNSAAKLLQLVSSEFDLKSS